MVNSSFFLVGNVKNDTFSELRKKISYLFRIFAADFQESYTV